MFPSVEHIFSAQKGLLRQKRKETCVIRLRLRKQYEDTFASTKLLILPENAIFVIEEEIYSQKRNPNLKLNFQFQYNFQHFMILFGNFICTFGIFKCIFGTFDTSRMIC